MSEIKRTRHNSVSGSFMAISKTFHIFAGRKKNEMKKLWPYILSFAALFASCGVEENSEDLTLQTTQMLQGTFNIKRYSDANGTMTTAWPGEYVSFSADSVSFFSLTPVHDFVLDQFVGYERKDKGVYGVEYLPLAVRFAGHTFALSPSQGSIWLIGNRRIELRKEE